MEINKIQILSTKKLFSSIIEQAKHNNIDIIEKEFISIQPILTKEKYEEVMALVLNKEVSNIVFTSANAVDTIKNYLHKGDTWYVPNWDIFCLSGKTKNSLSPNISPKRIVAAAENASALAHKIFEYNIKEVVFFAATLERMKSL